MKDIQDILISVVIPVYNGEKYVRTCIEQLQNQTLKTGYETIFVNDGSTDNTLEIIQTYAGDDVRIRVVSQENKGVSIARNHGIELARGEWIVFVDVDDDIAPGYLEDISQEIEKRGKSDILIYARHYVDKDSKEINTEKFTRNELICSLLTEAPLKELGTDYLLFSVWSKVYRKKMIIDNCISFVEGLRWGEDIIFQCRAFLYARDIDFIYRGYYRYVQNSDSTIHRLRKDDIETVKRMQKEMKQALLKVWKDDKVRRAFYKNMMSSWFTAISSEMKAWKQDENFGEAYKHLKRILREELLLETVENVKNEHVDKKSRIKMILLKRFPIGYLLMVRK